MKRKFKISKILLSVWCLFAVLLGTACAEPPAEPAEPTVIESSEFLPEPDEIVLRYDDYELTLSEEQRDAVYAAFGEIVETAEKISQHESDFSASDFIGNSSICMEFRYSDRHAYKLPMEGELAFAKAPFEYDRVAFLIPGFEMAVYREGQYYGMDNSVTSISFSSGGNLAIRSEFIQMISGYLLEAMVAVERMPVDTTILATEMLGDRPDNMVLIKNWETTVLSAEQQTDLYEDYLRMMEGFEYLDMCLCVFSSEDILEYFSQNTCLEFQYSQRRRFVGAVEGTEGGSLSALEGQEYDAILFVLDQTGEPMILGYKNGQYYGFHNSHYYLFSDSLDFVAKAMAIVP